MQVNIIKKYLKKNKIKYDYVCNVDVQKFIVTKKKLKNSRIFIAFYINKIRLIDNF